MLSILLLRCSSSVNEVIKKEVQPISFIRAAYDLKERLTGMLSVDSTFLRHYINSLLNFYKLILSVFWLN